MGYIQHRPKFAPLFRIMNRIKTTFLAAFGLLLSAGETSAQWVSDSIQMGPAYRNEIFYSLGSGTQGNSPLLDWELAHTQVKMDNCIRANHVAGVRVVPYPKGDISDWNKFDTGGWTSWRMVFNEIRKRELGAFNQQKAPGMWDFSWGVYNTTTHEVVGDSMYLLILNAGTPGQLYRKFYPVKQDASGNLQVRIAALDGSGDTVMNVLSANAGSRAYKYVHLQKKTQPLREPASSWDIVFTQYFAPTFDPMSGKTIPYPVMGVETNQGVTVAAIRGIDRAAINPADWKNQVEDNLTGIGSNWKSFNRSTNRFTCADSLSYLIKSADGQYWLLYFSRFDGSANGKVVFAKQQTNLASVQGFGNTLKWNLYPNPVIKGQALMLATDASEVHEVLIQISDASGRLVREMSSTLSGLELLPISTEGLASGKYFLCMVSAGKKAVIPFILP